MAKACEVSLIYNGASHTDAEWENQTYTGYQWKIFRTDSGMSVGYRDSTTAEWASCDMTDIPPEDFQIIAEGIQAALKLEL